MDYQEILDEIIEFRDGNFCLMNGFIEIVKNGAFFEKKKISVVEIMGRGNDDLMIESFDGTELNDFFAEEGVFAFDALLNLIPSDGTQSDYYFIEKINSAKCDDIENLDDWI